MTWLEEIRARVINRSPYRRENDLARLLEALDIAMEALGQSSSLQSSLFTECLYHREEWRVRNQYSDALRTVDLQQVEQGMGIVRNALERIEALSHPNSKDYPALEDE